MPVINRSALMPYSALDLYSIVNDVKSYPKFLPWCRETRVLYEDKNSMEASVHINKGPLKQWFTTKNILIEGCQIDMLLVDGPFQRLTGSWYFTGLEASASRIELHLDFEFNSVVASRLVTPVFSQIANTMVGSFCKRAEEIIS
jgi:ribosome-associated toxin RatA of RatAB toxin-antitoxin module